MITIVPRPGQSMTALARVLLALADGDTTAVRTGGGGLIVDEDLARTYLAGPAAPTNPPPHPASPELTALIRRAEAPMRSRAPRAAKPSAAAGPPAKEKEHNAHG